MKFADAFDEERVSSQPEARVNNSRATRVTAPIRALFQLLSASRNRSGSVVGASQVKSRQT